MRLELSYMIGEFWWFFLIQRFIKLCIPSDAYSAVQCSCSGFHLFASFSAQFTSGPFMPDIRKTLAANFGRLGLK